ncbi:DUF3293 domain-containing protein [Shewanella sp. OPT22]|nr:DUF3293 domain-containing protein [Shewanella sp. OPT22]
MSPQSDDLWHFYRTTHFLLTQKIANHLSFAIVTACNPNGKILSQSQNRLRDKALLRSIENLNCPYRAVVGAAKDMSHFEKSWAVFIEKNEAIQLGTQFVQNAIYYVNKGELTLVPVLMKANEECLGEFHHRANVVSEFPDAINFSK